MKSLKWYLVFCLCLLLGACGLVGVTESNLCQNRKNPKTWQGKKGFGTPDYGIMGLGYLPKFKNIVPSQKVNINSTCRLNSNKKEQLVKLIKHELRS